MPDAQQGVLLAARGGVAPLGAHSEPEPEPLVPALAALWVQAARAATEFRERTAALAEVPLGVLLVEPLVEPLVEQVEHLQAGNSCGPGNGRAYPDPPVLRRAQVSLLAPV